MRLTARHRLIIKRRDNIDTSAMLHIMIMYNELVPFSLRFNLMQFRLDSVPWDHSQASAQSFEPDQFTDSRSSLSQRFTM